MAIGSQVSDGVWRLHIERDVLLISDDPLEVEVIGVPSNTADGSDVISAPVEQCAVALGLWSDIDRGSKLPGAGSMPGSHHHPWRPVRLIPRMICRWKMAKTTIGGIATKALAAITRFRGWRP